MVAFRADEANTSYDQKQAQGIKNEIGKETKRSNSDRTQNKWTRFIAICLWRESLRARKSRPKEHNQREPFGRSLKLLAFAAEA